MTDYKQIIVTALKNLVGATLSKAHDKRNPVKIKLLIVGGKQVYQASWKESTKAFHKNYSLHELQEYFDAVFPDQFRQCVITTPDYFVQLLADKSKHVHVIKHENKNNMQLQQPKTIYTAALPHNRKKHYIIPEGIVIPWLHDLGVMNKQGQVARKYYDKFKQINKFLEFIDDIWPELSTHRPLKVIDFGCGKSYLTFAMHHYFNEIKNVQAEMTGLDLKQDVMDYCNTVVKRHNLSHLVFKTGDIAGFADINEADLVVCLHACDTATDYALAKAVSWNANAILAVPCCHKELIHAIHAEELEPMLKHGILRERMGSLVTDTVRALVLETEGYKTTIMEFIATEHTPKNILIRAQKIKNFSNAQKTRALEKLKAFMTFWNIEPLIAKLLHIQR